MAIIGLPLLGVALFSLLAVLIEAWDFHRRHYTSTYSALVRPHFWQRIRPAFYWPLAIGTVLVALLLDGAPLSASLLRGASQWLFFAMLHDSLQHPERTSSLKRFLSWVRERCRQTVQVLDAWLNLIALGIALSILLNLSIRGIWQSVGQMSWNRLFAFGCGLYLIALVAFFFASKAAVRSVLRESTRNWNGLRIRDLARVLRWTPPVPGRPRVDPASRDLLEAWLAWKDVDSLVSRVSSRLRALLTRRLRRSAFWASLFTFALSAGIVAASVSLLLPRYMVTDWTSGPQASEVQITLVVDRLAEVYDGTLKARLQTAGWSGVVQDPLLKITYLQAAIIASLLLVQTASSRRKLRAMAELDRWDLYRWLTLGTAYLILLENEFQYLYHGSVTRRLAGKYLNTTFRMRNDVLYAPSAGTKADAYRTICQFLEIYGHAEWETSPYVIALFGAYRSAREWAVEFLRFPPLSAENVHDFGLEKPSAADGGDKNYWLWSGDQLITFSSLEEARWFGRFVGQSDGLDKPEGNRQAPDVVTFQETDDALCHASGHLVRVLCKQLPVGSHKAQLDDRPWSLRIDLVEGVVDRHVVGNAVLVETKPRRLAVLSDQTSHQPVFFFGNGARRHPGDLESRGVGHVACVGMDRYKGVGLVAREPVRKLGEEFGIIALFL